MLRACGQVAVIVCLALGSATAQEASQESRRPSPQTRPRTLGRSSPENPGSRATQGYVRPQAPTRSPAAAEPAAAPASAAVAVVSSKDGKADHKRLVFRFKDVPALEAAKTLEQTFSAESKGVRGGTVEMVAIVPDAISNSLVIAGPPEAVEEVRKLAEELDHPMAMVRLEVMIGEAPAGQIGAAQADAKKTRESEKKSGQLHLVEMPKRMETLVLAQLTTLDNQPAYLQVGRREPRIVGTSVSQHGVANSVTLENLGTIVAVTPRVGPDNAVTLELDIEDSRLGPLEQGVPISVPKEGEPLRSPNIDILTAQTTLRIPDGQSVVVGGMARQAGSDKQRFIVVTPHVLPIGGGPR